MRSTPSFESRHVGWLVAIGCLTAAAALWWFAAGDWVSASQLKLRQDELQAAHAASPWGFAAALFGLFTVLSALAVPGCSVLALAAGFYLGWLPGTLLVATASTLGATLAFLASRHWLREGVRRRWGHRLAGLEAALARDGAYYLFTLRVAPVIPYALVNPLMGLSAMSAWQFFAVSFVGMLAGSAAYVYVGTALGAASGWHGITASVAVAALFLLAALPWLARSGWRVMHRCRVAP